MYVHGIRSLFSFPGYVLLKLQLDGELAAVTLRRDGRCRLTCPHCGQRMTPSRSVWQMARDLPLGLAGTVMIHYEAIQGRCLSCHRYATVRPVGIDEHARATGRLMRYVSQLARHLPLNHIADVVPGVDETTAGRWDRKMLSASLPEPNLDNLRVLLVDEKSIRKHHSYYTLVLNGETGELLHMGPGKKKDSLLGFYDKLTTPQKQGIEAVAMDRSKAYISATQQALPDAKIVYDKFHLIANYNDVIDRVRRLEYRKADHKAKQVIVGQRFNLFRNPGNLKDHQRRDLNALLEINRNLTIAYVLKEALRDIWMQYKRHHAEHDLNWWIERARESAIKPLIIFAGILHKARDQILNYIDHPITTGPLEGFNNLIARLLHRACGYKDMNYLYLKLRQESLKRSRQIRLQE